MPNDPTPPANPPEAEQEQEAVACKPPSTEERCCAMEKVIKTLEARVDAIERRM